jgi:hypothetical protein
MIKYLKNRLKDKLNNYSKMSIVERHGKKWTIPEVLKLHREYDLLKLSVDTIAKNHKRSVNSILYKLHKERFTPSLYDANGYVLKNKTGDKKSLVDSDLDLDSDADSSSDYNDENESILTESDCYSDYQEEELFDKKKESNIDNLSERVWSLETNIEEISSIVKKMFDQMTPKKNSTSSKNKLSM